MATAIQPKLEEKDSGGLASIAQILGALAPAFGSGTTSSTGTATQTGTTSGTNKSTASLDPAVKAQVDALLQNILGQNSNADSLIDSILQKAKDAFGPAIMQSIGSGNRAYSDTTLQRLRMDAASRAAADAAAAKLSFIQNNNAQAANLLGNVMSNTKTIDETKTGTESKTIQENSQKTTSASPVGKAVGAGASALGALSLLNSASPLLKKLKDSLKGSSTGGFGASSPVDPVSGLSFGDILSMFQGNTPVPDELGNLTNFPYPADLAKNVASINSSIESASGLSAPLSLLGGAGSLINQIFSNSGSSAPLGEAADIAENIPAGTVTIGDLIPDTGGTTPNIAVSDTQVAPETVTQGMAPADILQTSTAPNTPIESIDAIPNTVNALSLSTNPVVAPGVELLNQLNGIESIPDLVSQITNSFPTPAADIASSASIQESIDAASGLDVPSTAPVNQYFRGNQVYRIEDPNRDPFMDYGDSQSGWLDLKDTYYAVDKAGNNLLNSDQSPVYINQEGSFLDNSFAGVEGYSDVISDAGGAFPIFDSTGSLYGAVGAGGEGFLDGASAFEGATAGVDLGGFDFGFGGIPVLGPLVSVAQGNYGGAAGTIIGSIFGGPVGGFFGGTVGKLLTGGDSVVCTELLRQGRMSRELYTVDIKFASEHLSPIMLRGYRFWAIPFVRVMRRSEILSSIVSFFANSRAKSLQGRNLFGSFFRKIFEPICFGIGLFVPEKNWSVLYG